MSLDLYYVPASAPCRSIQMLAKALNLKLNLKYLDLINKEQLKPEFIKLNPQHTIPTLVDNNFSIWESRAILIYLNDKYAKDNSLYPTDPQKRATINQRLYFDMGTLYQNFGKYFYPIAFDPTKEADPEAFKNFEIAVQYLEGFLENSTYVAGEQMTIADFSLVTTVTNFAIVDYDITKFPNISRWYETCKETMPGWEINESGFESFKQYLDDYRKSTTNN